MTLRVEKFTGMHKVDVLNGTDAGGQAEDKGQSPGSHAVVDREKQQHWNEYRQC